MAEDKEHWRRIAVDGADITEHVAAMFDAIVGSLDWGSGFLDTETIESILIVAELAGFDVPDVCPLDVALPDNPPLPKGVTTGPGGEATAAWRAQIRAKAQAMRGGER